MDAIGDGEECDPTVPGPRAQLQMLCSGLKWGTPHYRSPTTPARKPPPLTRATASWSRVHPGHPEDIRRAAGSGGVGGTFGPAHPRGIPRPVPHIGCSPGVLPVSSRTGVLLVLVLPFLRIGSCIDRGMEDRVEHWDAGPGASAIDRLTPA